MITNIEQAVEVLNKHRWRERGDWQAVTFADRLASATPLGIEQYPHRTIGQAACDVLYDEDAIAIASYLELREAANK